MFDPLESMLSDPTPYVPPTPVLPPTQASSQAPQTGAGPAFNPLDMMLRAAQPAPALPPTDTSSLTPLTLLHFAAGVSQPRAMGQSTAGKVLQSIAGAAAYNMNERKQMEDRTVEQEMQRRKIAATDAQLEQARLGTVKTMQDISQTEQRFPLEMDKLRTAIQGAKTEQELTAVKTRIAKISETFAAQEHQAALDEKAAKSDQERAKAMMDRAHAQLLQRQAEELVNLAEIRASGINKPSYHLTQGLPGEPGLVTDQRTGQTYRAAMTSPADAVDWAKRQVKALEDSGMETYKTDTERKLAIQKYARDAMQGNIPTGASPAAVAPAAAKPAPAAPEAPTGSGMEEGLQKALIDLGPYPNKRGVWANKDGSIVVINGGNIEARFPNKAAFDKAYVNVNGKFLPKAQAEAQAQEPVNPNVTVVGPNNLPLDPRQLPAAKAGPANVTVSY